MMVLTQYPDHSILDFVSSPTALKSILSTCMAQQRYKYVGYSFCFLVGHFYTQSMCVYRYCIATICVPDSKVSSTAILIYLSA